MKKAADKVLLINQWQINPETGELSMSGVIQTERIDPQGIKLLLTLMAQPQQLLSKEQLQQAIWPNSVVNEEALARCISRVRKALGDDPRQPEIIETLPKRGYRFIAATANCQSEQAKTTTTLSLRKLGSWHWKALGMTMLVLVTLLIVVLSEAEQSTVKQNNLLIRQADDYYHRVNRKDNEMALTLYQQVLAMDPNVSEAHAGMANALVQRLIRMPKPASPLTWQQMSLGLALADGRLTTPTAQLELTRASTFAQQAITLNPNSAAAYKAYGFVLSAQSQFQQALSYYRQALEIEPNRWDVLINMGDIFEISGQLSDAIGYYKSALETMSKEQLSSDNHGRAWRASLAASIGNKYIQQNNSAEAEIWFRHVLSFAPYHTEATTGLFRVLSQSGRGAEAKRLCQAYLERIGEAICQ